MIAVTVTRRVFHHVHHDFKVYNVRLHKLSKNEISSQIGCCCCALMKYPAAVPQPLRQPLLRS